MPEAATGRNTMPYPDREAAAQEQEEERIRLIVVDDDADIRQLLADYLRQYGMEVATAEDGAGLFRELGAHPADLVVLDIMLPGEDGLSLCRRLRGVSPVPVIFLTALDSPTDRIVGLEIGGDDYMVKPFEPRELLARIRTVLRRTGKGGDEFLQAYAGNGGETRQIAEPETGRELCFGGWRLDVLSRNLRAPDGVLVNLSDTQYRLLLVFLEHPFQVLSRDQLLNQTQGRDAEPFDRSIDIQVSRLRTRLRDNVRDPVLFKTVRGGGYMLAVDVTASASGVAPARLPV